MAALWAGLLDGMALVLRLLHDSTEGLLGAYSWAAAIVLLTVLVRLVLLPLAIRQSRAMRAMQRLQPEIKRIKERYQPDRRLARSNPARYQAQRKRQQQKLMELYQKHGVNPAAGCLPLLAQSPVLIALFRVLRDTRRVPELKGAAFLFTKSLTGVAAAAGPGAWALVGVTGVAALVSQHQLAAANPGVDQSSRQALRYAFPLLLTVIALQLPVGVLLYWATTNMWTVGQQWLLFRT